MVNSKRHLSLQGSGVQVTGTKNNILQMNDLRQRAVDIVGKEDKLIHYEPVQRKPPLL